MLAAVVTSLMLATSSVAAAEAGSRAVVGGAVRLGALFAVHGAPRGAGGRCGRVREHYGIQRVEATLQIMSNCTLQALDRINADPSLLPRLALGAELRDSCWAPPTALRQTMDLVRDAIAPPASATAHTARDGGRGGASCAEVAASHSPEVSAPLLGVLGPGASAAAAQVQNLLQLFNIPQLSYSATARELSDRARFSTFYRVVPSDLHQARLLVALLAAHNWTYVHALHTDESYGQSGMAVFREEAARGGVCIAREEALRAAPEEREVDAALARLAATGGTDVAVCWCEGRTARALLGGLARRGSRLRLVASDGWADRHDVTQGLEPAARGALTLRIRSPYLTHFDDYYQALRPHTNKRNPWFREFWEEKFNCSLAKNPENGVRRCSGMESLAEEYTQEPKLALVVRGVYALAHALHDMRTALCPDNTTSQAVSLDGYTAQHIRWKQDGTGALCPAMLPFNVSLYRRFLSRVRFRAPDGGLVAFDENGDPPPELSEYDVMSLVGSASLGWRYARVGRWRGGVLRLRGGTATARRRAAGLRAQCSAPCRAGTWPRAGEGGARCCWACVPCPLLAVTRAAPAAGCRMCAPGARPDVSRTVCVPSPLEWGGGRAGWWARRVALVSAGCGLLSVAACAAVFWRHRATPVVKSASRELCALMLLAAVGCHVAALASALRPSVTSCAAVWAAAPALGGVHAAVLARTVRVARLVAAAERARTGRSVRLLSSRAQVCAWSALSAPGVAAAAWGAYVGGATPRVLHVARWRAVLACGAERAGVQLGPLAPALLLLAGCAVLAVRTRRLPHNLNETRFIGVSSYATCVLWAALFPLHAAAAAGGDVGARWPLLCACVSLCACISVCVSLGPRVWVCTCRPHTNTRHHFLTTTSIRCHLGKYRPVAGHDEAVADKVLRDVSSQTSAPPAEESSTAAPPPAAREGGCARVWECSTGDTVLVHIALPAHTHAAHQHQASLLD